VKRKHKKSNVPQPSKPTSEARRLTGILDGGVLRTLPNGVKIVRRRKHEWEKALDPMDRAEFEKQTDSSHGSKFLPSWTLLHYVNWLGHRIAELKWQVDAPSHETTTIRETTPVGYSKGELVRTIRIVIDSGFVHAYPVQD